jgi:RNA-directed DNA polymerase
MQDKLARWSTENKERKFDRLLRLITDRTWLAEAARVTLSSRGARTAGIDGVDKERMEGNLPAELSAIRTELLAGTYEPSPARRVYIPKAGDKTKLRPLGIPSLRDRIVQRAMLMAMQPIWESDFHRLSYGFRPERSVHHAIRTVRMQLLDGDERSTAGRWIIEGDLASYFGASGRSLMLSAGAIPASARGMSRPTENRALDSWR